MGAAWGRARAHNGAAHGRTMVLCRSAAWGCACGVPRGVHGGRGGGASPQAFGVSPAEALTRRILVPGLKRDAWPHHRLLASRCKGGGGAAGMGLRRGAAWGPA